MSYIEATSNGKGGPEKGLDYVSIHPTSERGVIVQDNFLYPHDTEDHSEQMDFARDEGFEFIAYPMKCFEIDENGVMFTGPEYGEKDGDESEEPEGAEVR